MLFYVNIWNSSLEPWTMHRWISDLLIYNSIYIITISHRIVPSSQNSSRYPHAINFFATRHRQLTGICPKIQLPLTIP